MKNKILPKTHKYIFTILISLLFVLSFQVKDTKAVVYIEKKEEHKAIEELNDKKCKFCSNKSLVYHSTVLVPVSNHKTHHVRHKLRCESCKKTYYAKNILEEKHKFQSYKSVYKYTSATKHKIKTYFKCPCDETKTNTVTQSHNKLMLCRKCTFPKKSKFTASSGKKYYFSDRPWIKITPKKTGYITISYEPKSGYDIYDSKKKKLITYNNSVVVAKKTYYIRLKKAQNQHFKYTFKEADGKNNSIKKATSCKRKKNYTNIILPSTKTQSRYYKITLSKQQKITFSINNNGREEDSFFLLDSNKKNISYHKITGTNYYTTYNSVGKGTYYVQYRSLPWPSSAVNKSTGSYVKFYLK